MRLNNKKLFDKFRWYHEKAIRPNKQDEWLFCHKNMFFLSAAVPKALCEECGKNLNRCTQCGKLLIKLGKEN